MKRITFKYRDQYNYPRWSVQSCTCESVEECKSIYGLGIDCEYEILDVQNVDK